MNQEGYSGQWIKCIDFPEEYKDYKLLTLMQPFTLMEKVKSKVSCITTVKAIQKFIAETYEKTNR